VKELVFQKTFNNIEDFNNVAAVIVDNSNSMREDIAQVSDFIQKINLENKKLNKESIGIFTVEGKDKEAHLNTLMSVLNKMQKNENRKEIVLMTDEPDNALDKTEYYQKIKQILDLSQEKNINIILKVLNSVGGEAYKVIELNEKNKDVLLSQHKDEATWYASLNDTP
jgi:ATP-dependent protease ClpP protease subunit